MIRPGIGEQLQGGTGFTDIQARWTDRAVQNEIDPYGVQAPPFPMPLSIVVAAFVPGLPKVIGQAVNRASTY